MLGRCMPATAAGGQPLPRADSTEPERWMIEPAMRLGRVTTGQNSPPSPSSERYLYSTHLKGLW
eukprot:scaffold353637_cov50-Prasinocladus_malaysianus.AAC.1